MVDSLDKYDMLKIDKDIYSDSDPDGDILNLEERMGISSNTQKSLKNKLKEKIPSERKTQKRLYARNQSRMKEDNLRNTCPENF